MSLDIGETWEKLSRGNSYDGILKLISDIAFKYNVVTIGKKANSGFYISIIDFSGILKRECQISDYEIYTPGSQIRNQCFLGRRGYTLSLKPSSVCMSSKDNLPNLYYHACVCEQEDFRW
ncbi:Sortilin-related receptor [Thelohanellus kitauei]|uniref:Sortilin-related receptor n=1 Tax=Thelohanellus kitauei TaxID=669202 RepID=A0A0C2MJH4_THEKT|nr:Sortilin-related receptor [Thelohanellus kitauei]